MELPIQAFCLNGYNGEKISMTIDEVLGFPNQTSYEGGYDTIGVLEIRAGGYHVISERYFSATGALYRFIEELKICYETLDGKAIYKLQLENDLIFTISMVGRGRAIIKGEYQERPDIQNILKFEIETDQTFFPAIIKSVEKLKLFMDNYHDELK